jgi:hypothetical protein
VKHLPFVRRILWAALSLCLFFLGNIQAQQPAYFMFGEEQFKGLQVYDVIQDGQDNYLFSTNEGLFYYDFLHFEQIGCAVAKSNAMFNFVADPTGTIYCSNLNHQIFRIQNKECNLFYTLLPDEDSPDLSLICTQEGELLACSKKIIRLSATGEVIERLSTQTEAWARPILTPHGNILCHFPETDSILRFKDGQFSVLRLRGLPSLSEADPLLHFFAVEEQLYAVDVISSAVFLIDESTWEVELLPEKYGMDRSPPLRLYGSGNSTWVAGSLPGVVWLQGRPDRIPPALYYEKYFVSDVYEDREGNILLSTFDHGIMVVPDIAIPDVINSFSDEPIAALHYAPRSGTLYLGTNKGNLLQLQANELKSVFQQGIRPVEGIFGDVSTERIIFQGSDEIMAVDGQGRISSLGVKAALKDAVFLSPNLAFLGASRGIFRCEWTTAAEPEVTLLPEFSFRVHHLVLDRLGKALVASTSHGLYRIPMEGEAKRITIDEQDLFPTAMYAAENEVFVATQQLGILALKKDKIVARIVPEIGRMEAITKLVVDRERIFVKSSHGLYQLGMKGQLQRNIGKAYGFLKARVFDFELDKDRLWVSHSGGVQAIDLSFLAKGHTPPNLRLAQVMVNDKTVGSLADGQFASDERKIRFDLAVPSLRNRESLRIHYQLEGYDDVWKLKPDDELAIVYNALEPGSYTFRAKAEHQGQLSEPVVYAFSIAVPIYSRWWFTALILVLVSGIVAAMYRRQMTLQRRKARQINELNASKLAAIQSQMNPHFIFNAMNSIQDLILKGDIENSYSYVTTFSNLVRSTLKYSEKDFIDFEQELQLLKLYLSLEKLRFEDKLQYEILDLVDEDIQIPPLLIQPFVENALLHGLLHKAGLKVLKIQFSLQEALVCTIEDNGVGRARAKAIRERQRGEHESFSGKAIRKRFDILSEVFDGEFGYFYEDLMVDGEPAGTRITLHIPVRRRF